MLLVWPCLTLPNYPGWMQTLEMAPLGPMLTGTQYANSCPMARRADHSSVKAKLRTYKPIAAACCCHPVPQGLAFSNSILSHSMAMSKAAAIPWWSSHLWFMPAPGLSVPPARHRLGAVNLLDCPLRAPVPIRGRSGSITQSSAGSEPCLSALLDAAPTAHSACLPSYVLSTHHRLQIPQHKKLAKSCKV